jgi:hypothetical protein
MTQKTYYIGFFKYDDSKIWQKTSLHLDQKQLSEHLNNLQYVDKNTINIREIQLPD